MIADNANRMGIGAVKGAVRRGELLLAGLPRCGHCGRKLHVFYSGDNGRYQCYGARTNHGGPRCISIAGAGADRAVAAEVLRVLKPIGVDAIQPGSFIGTSEMPQADGTGLSLEVHIFPPGVKMGEGHYPWDLAPGSMMTNGTVGTVTAVPGGRALDVTYPSGTRHIVVPPGAPVVLITKGDASLIQPGVSVFFVAVQPPGGGLITNAVSTGVGGVAPPM